MSESSDQKCTPPRVGNPCWIEIPATDVVACKKFYSELFPSWEFQPVSEKYPEEKIALWTFPGTMLGGGIVQVSAECKASEHKLGIGMTVFHFVETIEATQKRVEELGGKSCSSKTPEGDNGWYMYFLDVAGNRFGAYEVKKK